MRRLETKPLVTSDRGMEPTGAAAGATAPAQRLAVLDALRGGALLAMIVYHFCWDLQEFGLVDFDIFNAPFWIVVRTAIAGAFLVIVGISLALATHRGIRWRRFGVRLAKVVVAAGVVSAATFYMYPQAGVFFGILHNIAVASVLALPFVRWPWWISAIAAALVLAIAQFSFSAFDTPWLWWVGLAEIDVIAVDYEPLFPWFAPTLIGVALGRLIFVDRLLPPSAEPARSPLGVRALGWLGRHTLLAYLIHQPILIGLLYAGFYVGLLP